jgi:predicted RNA methylase
MAALLVPLSKVPLPHPPQPFDAFGWEDWQRVGDLMVSPGGRKLTVPVFERMRSASKGGKPPTNHPVPQETPPPSPELGITPNQSLAQQIAAHLATNQQLTREQLWTMANAAYGSTRAQGGYGPSEAYDAMEAGTNLAFRGKTDPRVDAERAKQTIKNIGDSLGQLPTQTNRSGNKDKLQQFSTPPHYAYLATWIANLKPGDTVLEPSAGTGSIAVHAANAGATVFGNELDPKRAELLKALLGDRVTNENAEQIAGILPGQGVPAPTSIVMNPPFSSTAGRTNKRDILTAAKHIDEALTMLAPGGRLVAIVGEGMKPGAPAYRAWFDRLAAEHSLRANVGVSGDEYAKSGTTFGTRVLVIDKTEPTQGTTVTGDSATIGGVVDLLSGVRDDRPSSSGASQASPAGAGGIAQPALVPADATGRGWGGAGRGQPTLGTGAGVLGSGGGGSIPDAGPGRRGGGTRSDRRRRAGAGTATDGAPTGGESPVESGAGGPGQFRPPTKLTVQPPPDATVDAGDVGGESVFAPYKPNVVVPGAMAHKAALVESAAMAAVKSPAVDYQPTLSPDVIEKGVLSDAQLESVVYAGHSHEQMLGDGTRRGYFIGDGTGVGKGRQIAGVITDNWNQGRKKAVWVSLKAPLHKDAQRDWGDLGNDPKQVVKFDALKGASPPQEGIAFLTYDTLRSKPQNTAKTNIDSLVEWLGPNFDGVIAFDEAHAMSNGLAIQSDRGTTEPSQRALAGIELQKRLPNARVVYVSATGATEVSNLAYADRLGLWGEGTEFPTKSSFVTEMNRGGVAAMEAVAQSLKAQGSYGSRSLSFDDGTPQGKVTYDRVVHQLTPDQVRMYDTMAEGWSTVMNNMDQALELTGGNFDRNAKAAAKAQFWGAQQRFFNQVMTAMQTPTVIRQMEADIKAGHAPVVQVVNTQEAQTKKALSRHNPEEDLENLDVSPAEILGQYLERSFPVHRYEKYTDENGGTRSRIVVDKAGNPVVDPQAVRMREKLLDQLGMMRSVIPESPIDQIINHFGPDQVAEVTGRSDRLVYRTQPDGTTKRVLERRPSTANISESDAFQAGGKKLLIFSDAGGTGRSYHADQRAKNQQKRIHYMLQPGWRADNAIQGLGRTHRTNQAQAPQYRLVEIEQLPGQKRFVSTIARRLDQLGALTKGQSKTGSAGLFKAADNLESREATKAMEEFFYDLRRGAIDGLEFPKVISSMGLDPGEDSSGRPKKFQVPPVPQFLNRLLSLRVGDQAKVFAAFDERLQSVVQKAAEAGTLNQGLENYKAQKIETISEKPVYRDPRTGAETRLLTTKVTNPNRVFPFMATPQMGQLVGYVRNVRSGRVRAVYESQPERDRITGAQAERRQLKGPDGQPIYIPKAELERDGLYQVLDKTAAEKLWDDEVAKAPKTIETEAHFITGALLPVWGRLPNADNPRIFRLKPEGKTATVGREIPAPMLPEVLKRFNIGMEAKKYKPEDVHQKLAVGDATSVTLSNGWKLKPVRVGGESRIELIGPSFDDVPVVEGQGAIRERIAWQTRLFVPTGANGAAVLRRILGTREITEVQDAKPHSERWVPLSHVRLLAVGCFGFDNWKQIPGGKWRSPGGRVLTDTTYQRMKSSGSVTTLGSGAAPSQPKLSAVYSVHPSAVSVDPERFQFKLHADVSTGTTGALAGAKFNRELSGVLAVWKDPADGKSYVVNGHHRLELARRDGAPEVDVRYISATNAKEARAKGALMNIAEGRGTAVDAAKFLRDTGRTADDLASVGISLRGLLAKDASALVKLDPYLFAMTATGKLDTPKAVAIAENLPDHVQQRTLVMAIQKHEKRTGANVTPSQIAELAKELRLTPTVKSSGGLFGGIDPAEESLFFQRPALKAFVRSELAKETKDFKLAASTRRAGVLAQRGNVLDTKANADQAQKQAMALEKFDRTAHHVGPLSDTLNQFALEISHAGTTSQQQAVRRRAIAAIRSHLSKA